MVKLHRSDCAIYNEPAYPKGECDCWWLLSGEDATTIYNILTRHRLPRIDEAIRILEMNLHPTNAEPKPSDYKIIRVPDDVGTITEAIGECRLE